MLVTPINLVPDPKPCPYTAWAMIIGKPSQVTLDTPQKPLRGDELDVQREVNFLLDDFMVIRFESEGSSSPCYALVLRKDGMTLLADSRNPQLFSDEELYRASLADWRPSLDHLRKAENDPLFAIALRLRFEFHQRSIPKPQAADEDDPMSWGTTPDGLA